LKVMYDTDKEETQKVSGPAVPPRRGTGIGPGLLAAIQWSPDSTVVIGRFTLVDTIPTGRERPREDSRACPVDNTMTSRPAALG